MNPTLSVLLPVWNVQATLTRLTGQLLEVLPELTPRFDLLIIDDGSTDATVEVAHDLCRDFPQIRLVVHPTRLGFHVATRTGFEHSRGELVLVRAEDCRLDLLDVYKLWNRMAVDEVVVARSASRAPLGWIPRLPGAKGKAAEALVPDLQLVRRRMVEGWLRARTRDSLLDYLGRQSFPIHEVKLRDQPLLAAVAHAADQRAPRRPNYLDKMKSFALGE